MPTTPEKTQSQDVKGKDTQQGEWSREASPYTNGPYMVLSDGSTFDGAEGCCVVYVTDEGEKQLRECSDFKGVELDDMEFITLSELMDAYNQVHGTDL